MLDKAWDTIESNQFGTNEFLAWCKAAGTEPLMGLNLGTGTAEEAAALVEYCNVDKGTKWSDLDGSMAFPILIRFSTGAWAMKWMARGRSGTCRRRSMA